MTSLKWIGPAIYKKGGSTTNLNITCREEESGAPFKSNSFDWALGEDIQNSTNTSSVK